MGLQLEDLAADGQVFRDPFKASVFAHWIKLATCLRLAFGEVLLVMQIERIFA